MMRYLLAWFLSSLAVGLAIGSGWRETEEERLERVLREVNERYE